MKLSEARLGEVVQVNSSLNVQMILFTEIGHVTGLVKVNNTYKVKVKFAIGIEEAIPLHDLELYKD